MKNHRIDGNIENLRIAGANSRLSLVFVGDRNRTKTAPIRLQFADSQEHVNYLLFPVEQRLRMRPADYRPHACAHLTDHGIERQAVSLNQFPHRVDRERCIRRIAGRLKFMFHGWS
ncbi:MAG: hypothetical protein WBO55_02545 [Rhizobiaceae bacterium]